MERNRIQSPKQGKAQQRRKPKNGPHQNQQTETTTVVINPTSERIGETTKGICQRNKPPSQHHKQEPNKPKQETEC